MFKGFYNLTSGMLTHGRNLNVISNNIANVSTTGFKADTFTAQPFDVEMYTRVGNKDKQYIDIGQQSYITAPSQLYTDYSQESFDATGEPLDLPSREKAGLRWRTTRAVFIPVPAASRWTTRAI